MLGEHLYTEDTTCFHYSNPTRLLGQCLVGNKAAAETSQSMQREDKLTPNASEEWSRGTEPFPWYATLSRRSWTKMDQNPIHSLLGSYRPPNTWQA